MPTYKTPDVYVEEISLFPPSVAEVETAVPAFIGYTETAAKNGESLHRKPTKVSSLVEYQNYFGFGPEKDLTVVLDTNNTATQVVQNAQFFMYDSLRMFFANGGGKCYIISTGLFKDSGGNATVKSKADLQAGLSVLKKWDEPTIIVMPDAPLLSGATDLYDLQKEALMQCGELMDRVLLCDLKRGDDTNFDDTVDEFRDKIGINNLKYGASYAPWLRSSLSKTVKYREITLKRNDPNAADSISLYNQTGDNSMRQLVFDLNQAKKAVDDINAGMITNIDPTTEKSLEDKLAALVDAFHSANEAYDEGTADNGYFKAVLQDVYHLMRDLFYEIITLQDNLPPIVGEPNSANGETKDFKLKNDIDSIIQDHDLESSFTTLLHHSNAINLKPSGGSGAKQIFVSSNTKFTAVAKDYLGHATPSGVTDAAVTALYAGIAEKRQDDALVALNAATGVAGSFFAAVQALVSTARGYETTFDSSLRESFSLYRNILNKISENLAELPPSGAIAGIYAFVDNQRGVWKAPANVSLNGVGGLLTHIDNKEQESLNVDVNAGKSVNAIRAFSGKGTLVWGARTLAGNDNEWRYVSVRRFFNMVEESVKKSTYWAVFEPNDANTWIKVKSMIENYLIQKWRDGALQGAKPEQAFFVKVGLGTTMSAQDILEGRMNVEIGMAVVRPAEFIILKFSHKMPEA
ncbi:MAG: phage tail protein [Chitinivibrionales bacterium]|nr:phage tail protein [Chitinivibrionales bacterium]